EEGAVLFRLDTVRARATEAIERQMLYSARVLEARLLAERDQREEIAFPDHILEVSREQPYVAQTIEDQLAQFRERKSSFAGQVNILQSRVDQAKTRAEGLNRELEATREQIGFIKEELVGIRQLYEKGLVSSTRL